MTPLRGSQQQMPAAARSAPVVPIGSRVQTDTLIIGGGLSGAYTAYKLSRLNRSFLLVEGRNRLGGRIISRPPSSPHLAGNIARFDLGPAWIWPQLQPLLNRLIKELDIPIFAQNCAGAILYDDVTDASPQRYAGLSAHAQSYRIDGGAARIVEQLARNIAADSVRLSHKVTRIVRRSSQLEVQAVDQNGGSSTLFARRVVLALPPRLMARTVEFVPALPECTLSQWTGTPTWMAAQAKVMVLYEQRFWRTLGLSGEVVSRCGPLSEIYDASPSSGGPYALVGFVGMPAVTRRRLGQDNLVRLCLAQLRRLFGQQAAGPIELFTKDWSEDAFTATADDWVSPAPHPVYGLTASGRAIWDHGLLLSGSETAESNGGLLEGALDAASAVLAEIEPDGLRG